MSLPCFSHGVPNHTRVARPAELPTAPVLDAAEPSPADVADVAVAAVPEITPLVPEASCVISSMAGWKPWTIAGWWFGT